MMSKNQQQRELKRNLFCNIVCARWERSEISREKKKRRFKIDALVGYFKQVDVTRKTTRVCPVKLRP